MQSYLSILCRLFRCNWTTLFVGWQGLGVFSPWRYDQEASQALFTEIMRVFQGKGKGQICP